MACSAKLMGDSQTICLRSMVRWSRLWSPIPLLGQAELHVQTNLMERTDLAARPSM